MEGKLEPSKTRKILGERSVVQELHIAIASRKGSGWYGEGKGLCAQKPTYGATCKHLKQTSLLAQSPAFYAITEFAGLLLFFKKRFRQFPLSFHRPSLSDQRGKHLPARAASSPQVFQTVQGLQQRNHDSCFLLTKKQRPLSLPLAFPLLFFLLLHDT